ncbi:MAG: T9SS type A sorting domain-containing protein [Bacteroidia bacterium]
MILVCIVLYSNPAGAVVYTWNGILTSTWSTATNWSPIGVPGAADDVIIVSTLTGPVYDGVSGGCTNLTMTSGTLNLGGFTFTATGNLTFNTGTVTNGTLGVNSGVGNTVTLAAASIFTGSSALSITAGSVSINGGTYAGAVTINQTGAANVSGTGGATFNGPLSVTLSGSGYWRTNGNNTYNNTVSFTNNGSNYLLPELNAGNNSTYNGTVTLLNTGSSNIRMGYAGTTTFNGNIILNSTSGTGIYFSESAAASCTLTGGKTITVGGSGFTAGNLYLQRFTQQGATAQNFTVGGTAVLYAGPTLTFNGNLTMSGSEVYMQGLTCNGTASITKTGPGNDWATGGNTFNSTCSLNSSGAGYFLTGGTNPDVFAGDLTINNSGSSLIYLAYQSGGTTQFNGNIILNCTGSATGIWFGQSTGTATLAAGKTITVGGSGFTSGDLRLKNFTQTGGTPQTLTLASGNLYLQTGTTFNGTVNFTAGAICLSGATYNGATNQFTQTGAVNGSGTGGNTFNGTVTMTNNGTGYFLTGNGFGDTFNGDLTVNNNSTNAIYLAYATGATVFNGNIFVNATSGTGVLIGANTGTSTMNAGFSIQNGGTGFSAGTLQITQFTQAGATAQNLLLTGTAVARIGPTTTLGGAFSITAPDIWAQGATYNGAATYTKTGGAGNHNNGNQNIFNSTCTINQQSSGGYFMLGYDSNDQFNDNITVTSTGTGGIIFGYSSGTGTPTLAAGKTILTGGAGFSSGYLELDAFTQLGNAPINLTFTGATTYLKFARGSVIGGPVTASCPDLYFNGATFSSALNATKTGANGDFSTGGNTFNAVSTFTASGAGFLVLGNVNPDTWNADVTFTETGSDRVLPCYNAAGNLFNGNIFVNATGSAVGINIGAGAASSASMAAGFSVQVGGSGFTSGYLLLQHFTQLGNAATNLTLAATANYIQFGPGSSLGGSVTASAPGLMFNGCIFNGTVNATKTGASNDAGTGGNTFQVASTITTTGSGYLMFGNGNPDLWNGDITYTNNGSNLIYLAYAGATTAQYSGNIILNSIGSSLGIRFGQNGGSASLANTKTISIGGSGFNAGDLYLKNFTQLGGTGQTMNTFGGVCTVYFQTGSTFNGAVNFVAPRIYLNGTTFNANANYIEKTGATNDAGLGGNTFAGTTTLVNSGIGYLMTGNGNTDNFNADMTFNNTGSSGVYVAYNTTTSTFNGNIIVNSTAGVGVSFGGNTGSAILTAGKTITVGGLGFSAGTLTLRNFTQVGGTAQSLTLTGTGILTVGSASTFNGVVNFTAPSLYLNGCTYNAVSTFTKNGSTSEWSNGGNVFNAITTLNNSGSGYALMGGTNADIYNFDAYFNNSGSNLIYLAYNDATGTQYNGNIYLNSTGASQGIRFGQNTGTAVLAAGQTINIGASGFNAGNLYIRNFTQTGATPQVMNTFGGTVALYMQTGTTFNGTVTFGCPQVYLNGSTFNGPGNLIEKTGATNNAGTGNNTFGGTTTIKNSGSGYFMLGNGNTDTFNADMTFTDVGTEHIYVAYATATSTFNGNIFVNCTGTGLGVYFSTNTGSTVLSTGYTINVGGSGFTTGGLILQNFTQNGATPQTMTLTGTAALTVGTGSTFNGNVNFVSPQLYLNGCTYNGTATLEKNGAANNASTGNNIFNATTSIKCSGSGIEYLANVSPDNFNASATFIQTGAGALYPAYVANCTFSGDISTIGTATAITFGNNGGRVTVNGTALQNFNGAAAQTPVVKRLTMATPSNTDLNLNVPVNIATDLTLTTGHIITSAVNVLTLTAYNVTTTIGNANSYINGPMNYVMAFNGSATLNLPLGKVADWRPAVLTVVHNAATSYTYNCEVFNNNAQALAWTMPATIDTVSFVHWWDINRTVTATGVAASNTNLSGNQIIKLYYDVNDGVYDPANLSIAKNTSGAPTTWIDIGGTGATITTGSVSSTSAPTAFNSFSRFTLANKVGGINALPVELLSFHATPTHQNTVDLTWTTASETNCANFTIQKSKDLISWNAVGSHPGAGNSSVMLNYKMIDVAPYAGLSYYRLLQTDFNGRYSYSNPVAVEFNGSGLVNVFPNPCTGQLSIQGVFSSATELQIYNELGQQVVSRQISGSSEVAVIRMDLESLPAGVYTVEIRDAGLAVNHTRIVKQ